MSKRPIDDNQSELRKSIAAVASKIRKFKDQRLGEAGTKSALIEPLLRALGWDISDPDEVHLEFKPTSRDCPVDYALKLMRAPRLFIEAKYLGGDLSDSKWVGQMLGYAAVGGVEWCVLTDGDEYRFYNASAPIIAAEKLFCTTRISRDSDIEVEQVLTLMTKDNLEDNSLERHWKSHYVDRRVKSALTTMIDGAEVGLIKLLNKRIKNLKAKEVIESLRRLEMQINVPSPFRENVGPKTPEKTSISSQVGRKNTSKFRPDRSLMDLIKAGILRPPVRLFTQYKKHMLEATLNSNGQIEFRGKQFGTCSAAGEAAKASVIGRRIATDGWAFWCYTDSGGKRMTLRQGREMLAQKSIRPSA